MAKKRSRSKQVGLDEPASKRKVENEEIDEKEIKEDEIEEAEEEEEEEEEEGEGKGELEEDEDDENEDDVKDTQEEDAEEVELEAERAIGSPDKIANIVPFLDSFYGLSSADPQERSVSAQAMLYHCLLGAQANTKDASYAMKRLLNGLCSSRACSRQGFGAALASFLKLAFSLGTIKEIQNDLGKVGSAVSFVRQQLLDATDTSQSSGGAKKNASDIREYQSGRLFGILSVVRSGTILPKKDGDDQSDYVDNIVAYVGCLAELYHVKSVKEGAASAIVTFLGAVYNHRDKDFCKTVVENVVRTVLLPNFLLPGDAKHANHTLPLEKYTSEQLAVVLFIQTNSSDHLKMLPPPFDKPIVSPKTIPNIAPLLSTAVTAPHYEIKANQAWVSLLSMITEPVAEEPKMEKKRPRNITRRVMKVGFDAAPDIMNSVLQEIVIKPLRANSGKSEKSSKGSNDHKGLALSFIGILCGSEYVDPVSGPSFIDLDPSFLEEKVLCQEVVTLIVDTLASSGKITKDLKPLAVQVLEALVEHADESASSDKSRRLACARALLRCEPRIDARTETTVASDLLMLGANSSTLGSASSSLIPVWTGYITFLLQQIVANATKQMTANPSNSDGSLSRKLIGYVDLLFGAGKQVIRIQADSTDEDEKNAIETFKACTLRRLLAFFMVAAFFKLSSLKGLDASTETKISKKNKKKGKEQRQMVTLNQTAAEEAAFLIKNSTDKENIEFIPYSLRTLLSSRFFSLLAEFAIFSPSKTSNRDHKDEQVYKLLSNILEGWQVLERQGAERYLQHEKADSKENDQEDPMVLVSKLCSSIDEMDKQDEMERTKLRWMRSSTVVEMALCLHLLNNGGRDSTTIDADQGVYSEDDDEVDEEEVTEFITDMEKTIHELHALPHQADGNPLMGLTELFVGILTSPIGIGTPNRGASSKLVREVVKQAWSSGLTLCASNAAACKGCVLDQEVAAALLDSMGASLEHEADKEPTEDNEEEDGDDDIDNDDNSDVDVSGKEAVPANNAKEDEVDASEGDESDSDDIVLDPSKLSTLLDESDDDENIELEHHEGADAALGKFIRAKQEARKAGQQARERLEITNNLRNSMLLEVLVSNPSKAYNSLYKSDVILSLLLPLLKYRNDLEKSLANSAEKIKSGNDVDKRALADRIGFLLKSKLCKMRLASSSIPFSDGIAGDKFVSDLLGQLVKEANKSSSREQLSCCSSAWAMALRSLADPSVAIKASEVHFQQAVHLWATQRKSGISASLLEDLIQQIPSVAKATMAGPLAKVAKTSRNFLKVEAFRLLSLLYGIPSQPPQQQSPADKQEESDDTKPVAGFSQLVESTGEVLEAIYAMLQDKDTKVKHRRDVVKTLEKVVAWISKEVHPCNEILALKLDKVATLLEEMSGSVDTQALKHQCEVLGKEIKAICIKAKKSDTPQNAVEKGSGTKKKRKSHSPKQGGEASSKKKKSKADKKK